MYSLNTLSNAGAGDTYVSVLATRMVTPQTIHLKHLMATWDCRTCKSDLAGRNTSAQIGDC